MIHIITFKAKTSYGHPNLIQNNISHIQMKNNLLP